VGQALLQSMRDSNQVRFLTSTPDYSAGFTAAGPLCHRRLCLAALIFRKQR